MSEVAIVRKRGRKKKGKEARGNSYNISLDYMRMEKEGMTY